MARYYFDIHDGQHLSRDNVGTECSGQDAIRAEAMTALPAIARDTIPKDGDRQALTVIVRNASNLTVYTATLTFASIWLGEEVPPALEDPD
ncbi:hypothetical protein SAMN02799631_01047 [Methylobacterium sp. 174MFSha1.1]|uniref:DUF6894 family protein n=1 Tax=Methylobacterium sp. 174MFSha1.1 TaxID=1502749 RepID=UPI0008E1B509|nr:hypothetical protein [Methylobacterium sp. 174MFSha1.1]SFU53466.1 hypothetical protein SAMN02799631_01047 [Methylobacterium sp. 174MFSha1.1]